MNEVANTRPKIQASRLLLWFAWGAVAYFAVAMVIWHSSLQASGAVQFSSMLSGAVAALGAVVAAGYLVASLWAKTNVVAGVTAFLANVACLAYFWASLP